MNKLTSSICLSILLIGTNSIATAKSQCSVDNEFNSIETKIEASYKEWSEGKEDPSVPPFLDTRTLEIYNNLRTMEARIKNFKESCPGTDVSSKEAKLGSYITQYKQPLEQLFQLLEVSYLDHKKALFNE